jgi:predicted ester cyclase
MTREEITAMFERRYENWNRRDTAALIQDLAENSVVESPLAGGPTRGRRAIEELHKTFFAAFPDARLRFDELLIDGHHVMGVGRLSGTDQGGFMGLAPTGRSFDIPIAFLYELENGLIVHERRIYDFTGLLVQVGALKAKPI